MPVLMNSTSYESITESICSSMYDGAMGWVEKNLYGFWAVSAVTIPVP